MINDVAQDIHSVYFYFPFSFDTDCLEDLGGKLKESELLCTLFNGDYIIRNIPKSPSYYDVTPQNTDRSPFWLYELGKSNFEVEQLSSNKGVLLKIQIKSIPKNSIGIQPKTNESGKVNIICIFALELIDCHKVPFSMKKKFQTISFKVLFLKQKC